MRQSENFLKNLLNTLLPNRAAPVLARVIKSHEGPGKNKYSVDVQVLKAGTLEETNQIISEVPITLVWAAKNKRGLYAIPNEGQVVIVEFLEWNLAYPYVSGIYSDEYDADEFYKNKFIITDGNGMWFIIDVPNNKILMDTGKSILTLRKDKFSEKNETESMYLILRDFMQEVHDMILVGPPPLHKVSPPDKMKIAKIMRRLAALMEA